jgi:uncharacterized membrane protein/glutaredoxin
LITITLYRTNDCEACDKTINQLHDLREEIPHQLVVIDLETHPEFHEYYADQVPVIEVGPYRLRAPFSLQELKVTMGAAQDRQRHLEQIQDTSYQKRLKRGHSQTRTDRFTAWLANHYMFIFNLAILIYVGTPFLAPIFLRYGITSPARVIYAIYSPLCHQLAFRSWFLFGEQSAYPRDIAQINGLITYEQLTGQSPREVQAARSYIGNEHAGYKVALCQRDIAIYGSILFFGLLFSGTRRRIKSLPWYLWILIGIAPIALDGFSQLPGLTNIPLDWLPIRESSPLLRTLTGSMFGITTAWYGYPFVEETMAETRRILARKNAVVSQESHQ